MPDVEYKEKLAGLLKSIQDQKVLEAILDQA